MRTEIDRAIWSPTMVPSSLGPRPNGRTCGWITSLLRVSLHNLLTSSGDVILRPLGLGPRLGSIHVQRFGDLESENDRLEEVYDYKMEAISLSPEEIVSSFSFPNRILQNS